MKNLLLVSVVGITLVGCAATSVTTYAPQQKQLSEPPIGSINTANLGDMLLTQGVMTERDALYFENSQKIGLGFTIHQGYFPKSAETPEYLYFGSSSDSGAGSLTDVLGMPKIGTNVIAVRKSDQAICTFNAIGGVVNCKNGVDHTIKNWITANSNNFQQTLLYNGKVGNKINIAYREFSSDLARPAFNNDVEYDLSESNQIGYKGALLEVIEANNQMIKYKVIKNFN